MSLVLPGSMQTKPGQAVTSVNLNVATGQAPLNTTAIILPVQSDAGIRRRALAYNYTGDKALTLTIQYDLGGTVGLQTVATLAIGAGSGTTQTGTVYPTSGASAGGAAAASGTAPTLAVAGSWDFLGAPAQRIQIEAAVAAGPTTVGVLQIDLLEQS